MKTSRKWFLIVTLAGLIGCTSEPDKESKKAGTAVQQIKGKTQVSADPTNSADAAMNAGGPSVYLLEGMKRYRLFMKTAVPVDPGKEYIVDGIYAQKAIDEIGDPDQGKNGYPLESSCQRVVRMAWSGLSFELVDAHASALRTLVKRYPARPVFLVTRLVPVTTKEGVEQKKGGEKEIPEVSVAAEKQAALLVEGPTVQPAPLWEPTGGTARCKVVINKDGKISELETGGQLCEAVPWSQFRYQPPVQGGHPVKVKTEVEVRFEPRK